MIITNSISKDTVKEPKLYNINSHVKSLQRLDGVTLIQTLPILENTPVMSTTFSLYMNLFKKERNLSKRNGGIKKGNAMSIKRGTAMFKNLRSKSISLL